jgi:uncharacterized protein YaaW (UPF0174 family)
MHTRVYTAMMAKLSDHLKPKHPTKLITVRVPEDLLEAAQAKAKKKKVTLTDVLLAGLKIFVEGEK